MKKLLKLTPFILAAFLLSACSSSDEGGSASGETSTCSPDSLQTLESGVLTIATGEPAYYPWVIDDAPESGEGFEAAVAYAVAAQLGYDATAVNWVRTTFDAAIAPGPKTFDF
ncbi:MAG: amino acid ABC transporter substrate-binding protein, partial [Candidatus Nanopelagicaceae bacterium]